MPQIKCSKCLTEFPDGDYYKSICPTCGTDSRNSSRSDAATDFSSGAGTASGFPASLARRYSDAYTEAHAVVAIGKLVKGIAVFLFIAIVIAGFVMASASEANYGRGEMNGMVAGIGFALAGLISVPTYVLGILVAAQGQTALATLDTAVNSSRHLKDDDVARVLSKRFSL